MQNKPGPRLLALSALGWLAGVAAQVQQAALPSSSQTACLAAFALLVIGLAIAIPARWRQAWPGAVLCAVACAALGHASTDWRAARQLSRALPAALEGADIVVIGVVAELPRVSAIGTRFVLDAESASVQGAAVKLPPHLALGWYRGNDEDATLGGPAEALRAGQRWRMTVRLRAPHGTLNPHGFDLELWLFEQDIGANGSVRARPESVPLKLAENVGGHAVERIRQNVRDAINARVADPAAAGVLAALAIGDQAAIDREGWDLFRITGVAHLMSISGLHVTMFAWLAGALVGRLWRAHRSLPLLLPTPTAARLAGWAAAAGYALLAGWGVPAQRTVWMIGTVVLLRGAGLRWPLHAVLLAAALVVVLADPWAMLQPGCWLSFVAVALLVASEPVAASKSADDENPALRRRFAETLKQGLRTQTIATVGLAPLTLVFFQQISVVGFLANLVAIPLVTLVVTPLALLGIFVAPLWLLGAWIVHALSAGLQLLAGWPLAVWSAAVAPPWAVACGLLAGALAVLPLPWRLRCLSVPLLLPLLLPPVARPAPGQFELVAADIGQGTAVLLRTQSHLLVFDTGPQNSAESDAGSRVLVPLLRARGEKRIDLLMLSHRDSDHVGGAAALLAGLPVAAMSSSLEDGHPLRANAQDRGVPHRRCDAGQSWDWDSVHFAVLHPQASDHAMGLKSNAVSCVLRVEALSGSALLTGDIEAAQEAALLQREGAALRSSVLVVPHHGSRTSSTAGFIEAVQPQVALVQAAYRSRFGHPAADVVARYTARHITVLRTDRCGAWTWQAGAPPAAATCERETARRYWHHRLSGEGAAAP